MVLYLWIEGGVNVNTVPSIAHRGYVRQIGRIVLTDTTQNLPQNEMMRKAYLGT